MLFPRAISSYLVSFCDVIDCILKQGCCLVQRSRWGAPRAPLFSGEEVMDLRGMILAMVDEPLVLVVKLADRLHNMRTVYALRPDRQRTVAAETMQVWCSLAERLGLFSLKVRSSSALSVPLSPVFNMPLCW